MSISEVWARHHELDGKIVRVKGFLSRCLALDCSLQESLTDGSKRLGIGSSDEFDLEAQAYLNRLIVVEGRLDAECLHLYADPPSDTAPICMDRASVIEEPKLRGLAR